MIFQSPFQIQSLVPEGTQVIFVSDLYRKQYAGGAELTTDALITSADCNVACIQSKDVTIDLLEKHANLFWVFGNFSSMNFQLIPTIVANIRYAIVEYDYKYCKHRSPDKHFAIEKTVCDCQDTSGRIISAFYYASEVIFWMSNAQRDVYFSMFPFLQEKQNVVLSSVFDKDTIEKLTMPTASIARKGWIVLGSNSWVKGFIPAQDWCKANHKDYEVVWNLNYDDLLAKLAFAEGFVYLPEGHDTCPRMVIEAKILGCKLQINDNVQHAKEAWFDTNDVSAIVDYLKTRTSVFWNEIKKFINVTHTLSGYTTTKNCIEQKYPFLECIQSMLDFCDEVCVVDGGSTDGTWEALTSLASFDSKLKIKQIKRDWDDLRFAVFDGQQKAEARKMCSSNFCWQMDSDEIVHENDYKLIKEFIQTFPKQVNLISLPVVEFWGSSDKARIDVTPWKWRLSRNLPNITHGIPASMRKVDENGSLYASEGTDGCDMINASTFEPIEQIGFYTQDAHNARMAALNGNNDALVAYQGWFNNVVNKIPGVFHYSWYDIERKIKTYKHYWQKHWLSLFNKEVEDTPENNMFFDKKWSDVTDDEIKILAEKLKNETGGWIWHSKWKGQNTPSIKIQKSEPKIMEKFKETK